jgi:hypothetical protein
LDDALDRRGYVAFDRTLVRGLRIEASREAPVGGASIKRCRSRNCRGRRSDAAVDARQRAAHFDACRNAARYARRRCAVGARSVACGQVALDGGLAGIYDMVTAGTFAAAAWRRPSSRCLSNWALRRGRVAFLQVNDDNAAALAVYRKFGFDTRHITIGRDPLNAG